MDWTLAIERNGKALRRILATLVAMAGGAGLTSSLRGASGGGSDLPMTPTRPSDDGRPALKGTVERPTLPRYRHRAILRLLRPAEAAVRRLVIVAARDIVVLPPPVLPRASKPVPTSIFVRSGKGTGIVLPRGVRPGDVVPGLARPPRRTFSLPLTDRLPRWSQRRRPLTSGVPRISAPGISSRAPLRRPPMPHDIVDATRLALRLAAVGRVLDDLPRHARRFARWRMRAIALAAHPPLRSGGGGPNGRRGRGTDHHFTRIWPLRPGRPPGARRRPTHEVHEVLADLHYFAFHALEQRTDSS